MKRLLLVIPLVLLIFTVPWFFFSPNPGHVGGIPSWAIYSIIATAVYSLCLVIFLGRFWQNMEEEN